MIEYPVFTLTLRKRTGTQGVFVVDEWYEWYIEPWNRYIDIWEKDRIINQLVEKGYQFSCNTETRICLYRSDMK